MEEIQELKEIIKQRKKDIIRIGQLLKRIKQKGGRSYLEILNEVGIKSRTASYYMKIAELENGQELLDEIGYTKLVVLLEAKKLDEKHLELAKTMSVSELKNAIKEENGDCEEDKEEIERIKNQLKKIINKYDVETFKKAFIELIQEIKVGR